MFVLGGLVAAKWAVIVGVVVARRRIRRLAPFRLAGEPVRGMTIGLYLETQGLLSMDVPLSTGGLLTLNLDGTYRVVGDLPDEIEIPTHLRLDTVSGVSSEYDTVVRLGGGRWTEL